MKISVIIPSFNAKRTLQQCLGSVFGQNCDLEVILIDDWSTDATFELAMHYVEHYDLIYVSPIFSRNSVAGARNLGLDLATGDLVAFLDSDDFWFPEKLSAQIAVITDQYLGVCCDYLRVSCSAHHHRAKYVQLPAIVNAEILSISNPLCTSGLLLWRHLIAETRFLNIGHEDYYFLYTICKKNGLSILSIPRPLLLYSVHATSMSSSISRSAYWWIGVQRLIGHTRHKIFLNGIAYFFKAIRKRI